MKMRYVAMSTLYSPGGTLYSSGGTLYSPGGTSAVMTHDRLHAVDGGTIVNCARKLNDALGTNTSMYDAKRNSCC